MKILYRPITNGKQPIVDFGDSWGRMDKDGKALFQESKKENPLWLIAFVAKWMQQSEDLTDFGEQYLNTFYEKYIASGYKKWRKEFYSKAIDDLIKEDRKLIGDRQL